MYEELFSSYTGLLSLGVIVFVLVMAAFFIRLFLTATPNDENKQ
ncbi:MAG: DUF3149 domain-containing protein [Betaproteobacteria bacterium HGW-Betaproteobacteria-22]|nr:MAG: DUF3149 domain-containing protein [Betaproteobacteria bacterium HGW-Betaproteobacteria-22]